jgi:hypothetical protein
MSLGVAVSAPGTRAAARDVVGDDVGDAAADADTGVDDRFAESTVAGALVRATTADDVSTGTAASFTASRVV